MVDNLILQNLQIFLSLHRTFSEYLNVDFLSYESLFSTETVDKFECDLNYYRCTPELTGRESC